jgi:hypothetical protein
LLLLNAVIETPGLVNRLFEVLGGREPELVRAEPSRLVRKAGLARKEGSREATQ